jgi:hypothetical protein
MRQRGVASGVHNAARHSGGVMTSVVRCLVGAALLVGGNWPTPAMGAEPAKDAPKVEVANEAVYTCPMHLKLETKAPGRCPTCGMRLVVRKQESGRP